MPSSYRKYGRVEVFENKKRKGFPLIRGLLIGIPLLILLVFLINERWRNETIAAIRLALDKTPPNVEILSKSPVIYLGGAAMVVFKVSDEHEVTVSLRINDNPRNVFYPQTFIKKGYYIALFAWYIDNPHFNAKIVATDQANNTTLKVVNIRKIQSLMKQKDYEDAKISYRFNPRQLGEPDNPFFKQVTQKAGNVSVDEDFMEQRTIELADIVQILQRRDKRLAEHLAKDKPQYGEKIALDESFIREKEKEFVQTVGNQSTNKVERYQLIERMMQQTNRVELTPLTRRPRKEWVTNWALYPFYPIKNPNVSSEFGYSRQFVMGGTQVRNSLHLGVDLCQYGKKNLPISVANDGEVLINDYDGKAGNIIAIHHGLGLYSVYMHCSAIHFQDGESVSAGSVIGITGSTGYSTGDHLHFSIMVQGRYVNPWEWMTRGWLDENIHAVIERARDIVYNDTNTNIVHSYP